MNDTHLARTVQWIVIIFLLFCGPLGWVLIYLLWKQWNPTAPIKKSTGNAKAKTKKAAAKPAAKAPAKKKSTKK